MLETLRSLVRVWIFRTFTEFGEQRPRSYEEHLPIFEAIRDHRVSDAERAMAAHMESATARLMAVLERTRRQSDPPSGPGGPPPPRRGEEVSAP